MSEEKIQFMFRIEKSLKVKAEKIAEKEGVTLSALIRRLVADYVGADEHADEIAEIKQRLEIIEKEIFDK